MFSALPRTADIEVRDRHVSVGPMLSKKASIDWLCWSMRPLMVIATRWRAEVDVTTEA
jgi:hypothetical protein